MARAIGAQPLLTLDRYRILLNIPIWAYNGIDNPDETLLGCDTIWTQWQREQLAISLRQSEHQLGNKLGFTLGLEYQVDSYKPWTNPMLLEYGHVVGGGIRGRTEVTPSASDFTIVTATITVAQSDFESSDEVVIVEDDTDLKIIPDKIKTSGTDYIISISQAKLINWDNLETQSDPIDYNAAFPAATWLKLADLTVYREYRDESEQATIVYGPYCSCICGTAACQGTSYTACIYVIRNEIGAVKVQMADYDADDETWTCTTPTSCGCYEGDRVEMKYLAGTTGIPGYEQAITRLAHSYMMLVPCGCALVDLFWERDRNIPTVLTAERINCPFGSADGAWFAWQWTRVHEHGRAFML